MKWSIAGLLVMGVIAAVSASALVAALRSDPSQVVTPTVSEPEEVQIVLAVEALPAMQIMDAGSAVQKTIMKSKAPAHAFSDVEQVIGKVLVLPVVRGQVLTKSFFAPAGSGAHLASVLPEGMRAVTVSLSNYAALRGLLYPGCIVDVLASFRLPAGRGTKGQAISTTLLRSVQVLAVNRRSVVTQTKEDQTKSSQSTLDKEKARLERRGNLITLRVNPRQAEALQLATRFGSVSLTLRNPLDSMAVKEEATLLHGGKLAKLADIMASSVPNEPSYSDDKLGGPLAAPEVIDSIDISPATKLKQGIIPAAVAEPMWETIIIRGGKYDKRTFPMPKNLSDDRESAMP